jgi:hypothetical protein
MNASSSDFEAVTNKLTDTQPLGMGLETRMRGRRGFKTIGNDIYTSSIFGESGLNNIVNVFRTFGLSPLTTTGNFLDYPTTGTKWRISSTSNNDTLLGTGARKTYLDGLDSDWNPISETVEMNGQAGVLTTLDWFRINKIFVTSAGALTHNEGTLFVTSDTDTLALGIPVTTTYASVLPMYSAMTIFTYSVPVGYDFEYVIGNFFTTFVESKPGIFEEYYRDESSGELITSYTDLFNSGNVTYNYWDAVGWYGKVTIEGRICADTGTQSGTVFYEFALTKQ